MKILITGATGFVGSHLIDLLDLSGHKIYSLYRSEIKLKEFNVKGTPLKGTLTDLSWVEQLPKEQLFSKDDELRIGVFICHCGTNIA